MGSRRLDAALAAVCLLAAAVRLSQPTKHFVDGRLIPVDADAAYHYRRALSYLEPPVGLPSVFDPFLGFPQGATVPWAPGWDAWLALCGSLGGLGQADSLGFQIGIALAPLLAACATVFLAGKTAGRLFGDTAGILAAGFVALVPQHVAATQFGNLDHNAVEGLVLLALANEATRERLRPGWIGVLVAGACLGWVGGLMYAALGMAAVCGTGLLNRSWRGVAGMALGVALLAPPALAMGIAGGQPFTYAYLSGFHPAVLAGLTLGAAWLTALVTRPALRRSLGLSGGLAVLVGGALLAPSVWTGLRDWLLTGDPWLDTIPEMQPLFSGLSWERLKTVGLMLSWALYALPVALGWLGWRAWKEDRRRLGLVGVASGALVLTLLQNRFGWTLAPLMGVALAGALAPLGWKGAVPLLLALVLHPLDALEAAWMAPRSYQFRKPWAFEAYHWMRENTPSVDPETPAYGVAGNWDHGHWVSALAERPEHIGHFGTYAGGVARFHETQAMYQGTEAELLALMDRDQLRYLVLQSDELRDNEGPLRVLLHGGSAEGASPHLGGLRAVFATETGHPWYPELVAPGAWVYERVEGATLVGVAEPGAGVGLVLETWWLGEVRPWRARTQADEEGRWSLRVPYWTGDRGAVPTGDALQLQAGSKTYSLTVSESQVREGATVPVPPG